MPTSSFFTGPTVAAGEPPPPNPAGTRPSAVWAGAYTNCGCFAPAGVGHQWRAVAVQDVGGHMVSTDGVAWWPANAGTSDRDQQRGSCVEGSRTTANRLYSYVSSNDGIVGDPGFLLRGVYDRAGLTIDWTVVAALTAGARAGNAGDNHPRQVGRTMALDEANDVAVLGTIDGLAVVTLSTGAVSYRALAGHHVTGVVLDPSDTQLCYCTVDDDGGAGQAGVHRVVNIRSGTVSSTRYDVLTNPQDIMLVSVGGSLYCYVAAANQGIRRWQVSADVTAGWTDLTGTLPTTQGWAGIDARDAATLGTVLLLAATAETGQISVDAGAYSTDGGTTWVRESVSWTQSTIVAGTATTWWRAELEPAALLNGNTYECACPRIDPADPDVFHLYGRSGVWRSTDGGGNWQPTVQGLCGTNSYIMAPDPSNSARVYAGDNDFTAFRSTDRFALHAEQEEPAGADTLSTFELAWTPTGTLLTAEGVGSTNTGGEVYLSTNPWAAAPTWTAQGFNAAAGGGRAKAVAIGAESGSQVILAVIDGAGIWRKVAAGTPTQVATTPTGSGDPFPKLCWPGGHLGRQYVYAFAPNGLFRSSDHGATWSQLWAVTNTYDDCGSLAVDPGDLNTLYVTVDDNGSNIGLYQISNAHSTPTITRVGPAMNPPGRAAVHPASGVVYVCSTLATAGGPKLYRSPGGTGTITGATVFQDITDTRWRSHAHIPAGLAVGEDGAVYFASGAGGYLVRD